MQPQGSKWLMSPEPLQPPTIDPRLTELNTVVRSAECLLHFVLSIEYWLSPNGRLRLWLKINFCLCAWLFVPAITLMPIISLVFHELDGWLSMLVSIILKLIVLGLLVFVAVVTIKHFLLSKGSPNARHRERR